MTNDNIIYLAELILTTLKLTFKLKFFNRMV